VCSKPGRKHATPSPLTSDAQALTFSHASESDVPRESSRELSSHLPDVSQEPHQRGLACPSWPDRSRAWCVMLHPAKTPREDEALKWVVRSRGSDPPNQLGRGESTLLSNFGLHVRVLRPQCFRRPNLLWSDLHTPSLQAASPCYHNRTFACSSVWSSQSLRRIAFRLLDRAARSGLGSRHRRSLARRRLDLVNQGLNSTVHRGPGSHRQPAR
jgi:hypothetical protein